MSHRAQIIRGASRSTYIRTVPTDGGLKAWHLRDFVKALDAAGIPDDARLECHKDTGTMHFSSVSVRHTEDIEGWPGRPEPVPDVDPDSELGKHLGVAPSTPKEPA